MVHHILSLLFIIINVNYVNFDIFKFYSLWYIQVLFTLIDSSFIHDYKFTMEVIQLVLSLRQTFANIFFEYGIGS